MNRDEPGHDGEDDFIALQIVQCRRTLLRRLRVVRHRRAGADEVAVTIDVVDASDRTPIFV